MRQQALIGLVGLVWGGLAACAGSASSAGALEVVPPAITLQPSATHAFAAELGASAVIGVTWSVSETSGGSVSATGLYTAPAASGTFHVVATLADNLSAKATVTVGTPPVAVVVSPAATSVLAPSGTQQFTAAVSGTTHGAVTWSMEESGAGSISDAGVYSASADAGVFHVVATSEADATKSGTAQVTVSYSGVVGISVSPTTAALLAGQTQTFVASVTGSANSGVTWSVQEGSNGGTVTQGVYTAPPAAGTFHVVATSQADNTKSATAAVVVTVPQPTVAISPKSAAVKGGQTVQFTTTVSNASNTAVTWSVLEGSSGGRVSSSGLYTAPGPAGTYHVVATSVASSSASATANVVVRTATPTAGVWTSVTPSNVNLVDQLNCGNYGTQTVAVDPQRPSDAYAMFDCQGIWKSTDFGYTWTGPINTGTNGSKMAGAGGIVIPSASTSSPPLMYAANIRDPGTGFWRSTDGGISWTNYVVTPGGSRQDFYPPATDPYDVNHLLMAGHEMDLLVESTDGGQNWVAVPTDPGMAENGGTAFAFFVDTGNPATTRTTFLWLAQQSGGVYGTWRTSNDGGKWTMVDKNEHPHGNSELYQPGGGVIYMAGAYSDLGWGVLRSADYGQTWAHVGQAGNESTVIGTANHVYAMFGWAVGLGTVIDPALEITDPSGLGSWSMPSSPALMVDGPAQLSLTNDGSHNILLSANYLAGLWFYEEP